MRKACICQQLADVVEARLLAGQRVWLDREKTVEITGLEYFFEPDDQGNVAYAILA